MVRKTLIVVALALCVAVVALTAFDLVFNPFKVESWKLPVLYHRWKTNPTAENEAAAKAERDRVVRLTLEVEAVEVGVIALGLVAACVLGRRLRHA